MSSKLNLRMLKTSDVPSSVLEKRWPKARRHDPELENYVKAIIEEVRRRGDAALADFTAKLDGVSLQPSRLRVSPEDVDNAYRKVGEEQIAAIKYAKDRVAKFQKNLLKRSDFEYRFEGVKIRSCAAPLRRVGCYVPGGRAAYPSSLVMTIVPAKVAGVQQVVVCSPPREEGEINPLILVAADVCGVDEIYRVGGVQAIAALAYGTETIQPADKLFGPGNKYVLAAKMLVSHDVPIDIPAGPSEIVILADRSAQVRAVALDMISQAEHMDGVSVLITPSRRLGQAVASELERMASSLPNREIVVPNLSENGLVLLAKDLEEAIGFVNDFAPEHVEVMVRDAWRVAERITSAGLVLVGRHSPVSASDYCLGTVHILPTKGFSQVYSGLSVLDFIKRYNIVECSKEGLEKAGTHIRVLAESEGLINHCLAVKGRLEDA